MANKKSKKEPFQWERFIAAKKRAKISITKLGSKDDGIGWSEKTIRRAKADGEISPEILDLTDWNVFIPMAGTVESLNVSSTAAIILFYYLDDNEFNN